MTEQGFGFICDRGATAGVATYLANQNKIKRVCLDATEFRAGLHSRSQTCIRGSSTKSCRRRLVA